MRFLRLLTAVDKYFKICEADIISDMKKRVWFSTLPFEQQSNEINLGVAAEGRHNIIKYGSLACAKEMNHYYPNDIEELNFINKINAAINNKNYKEIIELSIEGFSNNRAWQTGYGGVAWLNIAKSLYHLIKLDEKLETARRGSEERIKILKEIIIELNIFDGLSHNTDSIMKNIIQQETAILGEKDWVESFKAVLNIMDAKELEDPLAVQHIVSLHGTGGSSMALTRDNPYRGMVLSKQQKEKAEKELELIRIRKVLEINSKLKKLKIISSLIKDFETCLPSSKKNKFETIYYELDDFISNLHYDISHINNFVNLTKNTKLDNLDTFIKTCINEILQMDIYGYSSLASRFINRYMLSMNKITHDLTLMLLNF